MSGRRQVDRDGAGDARIERLGHALGRIRPGLDEDEAVAIARRGMVEGPAGRRLELPGRLRAAGARLVAAGPRRRLALAGAGALAVAALVALPSPDPGDPDPSGFLTDARTASGDDGFSIEAPAEGSVAVFQTTNPRIRVVWFTDPIGTGD